jgi:hypothetical protein
MEPRRIRRERKTVTAMIRMYCRDRHDAPANGALCEDCRAMHDYAMLRIDKCPFCLRKPTCANCTVHCYKRDMREEIRTVMRYAGPRMLWRHPWLTVRHLMDGLRTPPELPKRRTTPITTSRTDSHPQ